MKLLSVRKASSANSCRRHRVVPAASSVSRSLGSSPEGIDARQDMLVDWGLRSTRRPLIAPPRIPEFFWVLSPAAAVRVERCAATSPGRPTAQGLSAFLDTSRGFSLCRAKCRIPPPSTTLLSPRDANRAAAAGWQCLVTKSSRFRRQEQRLVQASPTAMRARLPVERAMLRIRRPTRITGYVSAPAG